MFKVAYNSKPLELHIYYYYDYDYLQQANITFDSLILTISFI